MSEEKNIYSRSIWEDTKDEAGLVVTGCLIGAAIGVGGGYIASQGFGTPVIPSLVVGGSLGTVIGGGVTVYAAHRMHEAKAAAALHADYAVKEYLAKNKDPQARKSTEDLIAAGMAAGMAQAMEPVFDMVEQLLPPQEREVVQKTRAKKPVARA